MDLLHSSFSASCARRHALRLFCAALTRQQSASEGGLFSAFATLSSAPTGQFQGCLPDTSALRSEQVGEQHLWGATHKHQTQVRVMQAMCGLAKVHTYRFLQQSCVFCKRLPHCSCLAEESFFMEKLASTTKASQLYM